MKKYVNKDNAPFYKGIEIIEYGEMVEPAGVEPASKHASEKALHV